MRHALVAAVLSGAAGALVPSSSPSLVHLSARGGRIDALWHAVHARGIAATRSGEDEIFAVVQSAAVTQLHAQLQEEVGTVELRSSDLGVGSAASPDAGTDSSWDGVPVPSAPAFAPLRIGRLWLAACGEFTAPPAAHEPLWLLDGDAFLLTVEGRLHHSTRMLLSLLCGARAPPSAAGEQGPLLDYGCGSGVLALAALRAGTATCAYATDVSAAALGCAARNAQLNRLGEHLSLCLPWELPATLRATFAVANMLPGPLLSVAEDVASRVAPGGELFLTGFRADDAPAVRRAYGKYFDVAAEPVAESAGWLCLACSRRENADPNVDDLSEAAVA